MSVALTDKKREELSTVDNAIVSLPSLAMALFASESSAADPSGLPLKKIYEVDCTICDFLGGFGPRWLVLVWTGRVRVIGLVRESDEE